MLSIHFKGVVKPLFGHILLRLFGHFFGLLGLLPPACEESHSTEREEKNQQYNDQFSHVKPP